MSAAIGVLGVVVAVCAFLWLVGVAVYLLAASGAGFIAVPFALVMLSAVLVIVGVVLSA